MPTVAQLEARDSLLTVGSSFINKLVYGEPMSAECRRLNAIGRASGKAESPVDNEGAIGSDHSHKFEWVEMG